MTDKPKKPKAPKPLPMVWDLEHDVYTGEKLPELPPLGPKPEVIYSDPELESEIEKPEDLRDEGVL